MARRRFRRGLQHQVPDRSEVLEGSVERLCDPEVELGDAKKKDSTPFPRRCRPGVRVRSCEPEGRGADHLRPAPWAPEHHLAQVAVESMVQLASGYSLRKRKGGQWGSFDQTAWQAYLATIAKLGQTKKQLSFGDIINTSLIAAANKKADIVTAAATPRHSRSTRTSRRRSCRPDCRCRRRHVEATRRPAPTGRLGFCVDRAPARC